MSNAKVPLKQVSRFGGNKGSFGSTSNSISTQKFTPKQKVVLPAIRITQNKGGGGK